MKYRPNSYIASTDNFVSKMTLVRMKYNDES